MLSFPSRPVTESLLLAAVWGALLGVVSALITRRVLAALNALLALVHLEEPKDG